MKQQSIYPFSSISLKLTADAIEWLSGTTTDNDGNEIQTPDKPIDDGDTNDR